MTEILILPTPRVAGSHALRSIIAEIDCPVGFGGRAPMRCTTASIAVVCYDVVLSEQDLPMPEITRPGGDLRAVEDAGRGDWIRTSDHLHPMQVRYQAALRPDLKSIIAKGSGAPGPGTTTALAQRFQNAQQLLAKRCPVALGRSGGDGLYLSRHLVEAMAGATDGKPFVIQQLTDAADQQHFVMLVIAAVTAPLDRFELGEFLLPVAQHVRFDTA